MKLRRVLLACLLLAPWLWASASLAAPQKKGLVRCDAGQTIGQALKGLDKLRPNVVAVSGTCQENVVIEGFDDLRIVGQPEATLVPVPPTTSYAIDVRASRRVTIENLTIRQTPDRTAGAAQTAIYFWECAYCRLANVTVDGGVGVTVIGGQVFLSAFSMIGPGGYTAVSAWRTASVDVEDSTFEGGGPAGTGRFAGVWIGDNAVGYVQRSQFRRLGAGVVVQGELTLVGQTTIEDNDCVGAWVMNGARLEITEGRVRNNGASCFMGGINADGGASVSVGNGMPGAIEVTGNVGGGIVLNHRASLSLSAGSKVANNQGTGLSARNGSLIVGPTGETMEVSGHVTGHDVFCDALSQINNAAQIVGATSVSCPNLWPGDGPP